MDIRVDGDRVLVAWSDRGSYLALAEDGTVEEVFRPVGEVVRSSAWFSDDYMEGVGAAFVAALAAVRSAKPISRKEMVAAVETARDNMTAVAV